METIDRRRVVGLDLFVAVAALAVLISLFFPWFVAEYEPHAGVSLACFDDSSLTASGRCLQTWSGWRTISIRWALPIAAFIAFPTAGLRILGDHQRPADREWLTLTGALVAVVALGFFLTPDLAALNQIQADQAALYSTRERRTAEARN